MNAQIGHEHVIERQATAALSLCACRLTSSAGPEQVFQLTVTKPVANIGAVIVSRAAGRAALQSQAARVAGEKDRRALNQAFFDALYIDEHGVDRADLASPFAELTDRTIGLQTEHKGPTSPETTNPEALEPRGSNVVIMAEKEGFEPSSQTFIHLTP